MGREPSYEELKEKIGELEKEIEYRRRKEEANQITENRWPSLLSSIPNTVVVLDLQGQFIYTNGLPGLTPKEAEGKNVYDFIPDDHQYKLRQAMRMALLTGDTQAYEIPIVLQDGRTTWWSNSIKPIKRAGQLVEYLAIATDITQQKRDEQALKRRDAILGAISIALEHVLKMSDLAEAGDTILELLGKATNLSRAYIFKNSTNEKGELFSDPVYQWIKPGIGPAKKVPEIRGEISYKDSGLQRWATQLSKAEIIQGHVKDFPAVEQKLLEQYGILSIIMVPIFVGQEWWGFIGFDEFQVERTWSVAEVGALRAAGRILGGVIQRKQMDDALRNAQERLEARVKERTKELEVRTGDLEEVNTALKVLLKRREEDKAELEEKVLFSVKELITPHLEKLKDSRLNHRQKILLGIVEANLEDIVSPFMQGMPTKFAKLTPTEIQVANLVKQGKITKEIAELLTVSTKTIDRHRDNIRRKVGIKNKKINLRTHLLSGK